MRAFGAIATLLLLAARPVVAQAEVPPAWGLGPLMHAMAEVRSASASFAETTTMAILKTPLQSAGTLRYVAPDFLSKTLLTPERQNFTLQKGAVTLTAGGRTQRFDLDQAPLLAGLVGGLRATLAGDLPSLRQVYAIQLSGGAENWQLLLRPNDPSIRQVLSWIAIRGSANRITAIDTGGAQGALNRMSVHETIDDPS